MGGHDRGSWGGRGRGEQEIGKKAIINGMKAFANTDQVAYTFLVLKKEIVKG